MVSNPSLETYQYLEMLHTKRLTCPCSNTAILYREFLSLSPIFHQICSSKFIGDVWIEQILTLSGIRDPQDWRNKVYSYFLFLRSFCSFSSITTDEAVDRFLSKYFILSSVINEKDFKQQFNAILEQFYYSTFNYSSLLIDTARLLAQTDQPYFESIQGVGPSWSTPTLILENITDHTNSQQSFKVWMNLPITSS